jgi:putative tricarboxylic transport membrane protein
MKRHDRMSSLFCIGLAFYIGIEAIRIDPGTLSNPGPGLVPLGCGLILGISGLIVFISSYRSLLGEVKVVLWGPSTRWRDLILTIILLVIFALLINFLGFHLVTLVWMMVTCRWVGRMGWKATILTSVITVISSYAIFSYSLGIRLPLGIIGTLWF